MVNKPIRGFKCLVGKTIKKIDAQSINCVKIETQCGEVFEIWAEDRFYEIEVIKLTKSGE